MFERGKIILVPFPFTDLTSQKIRPALIVSKHQHVQDNVIVAFITSRLPKQKKKALIVLSENSDSFPSSGLKVESTVRCDKIATLDKKIILGEIGKLKPGTMKTINSALQSVLGL